MNKKPCFLGVLMVLLTCAGFAQTASQRQEIVREYELSLLNSLAQTHARIYKENLRYAEKRAALEGRPTAIFYPNGQISRLKRIDRSGNFIYNRTFNNIEAARTIGTDQLYRGGVLGLALSGKNMRAGVWDAGKVRGSHELLTNRVSFGDDAEEYDDHSTHVAGTLIGGNLDTYPGNLARGMAFEAELDAYDWDEDFSEMYAAAQQGLLVSNHSYGPDLEQVRNPEDFLGKYDDLSEATDNLAYLAPYYTMVVAAGNDRNASYTSTISPDGYSLLTAEMNTAKNNILVTAVYPVESYEGPGSVEILDFSSFGPTNDLRIKPDLAADGWSVLSSAATDRRGQPSDSDYAYFSGTSSAAPAVAGSVLLLQELSALLHEGTFLKSSSIRALLIGTALEAGENRGPDPIFGWGLTNVEGAAQLLLEDANSGDSFIREIELSEGEPFQEIIESTGDKLKITMAWTDPPAKPQRRGDSSPRLVNDLDIRLINGRGESFYPWRLNEHNFREPALRDGDNAVDNVEQTALEQTSPGEIFTLNITHKGNLEGGKQVLSLVGVGAKPAVPEDLDEGSFLIYPNPAHDQVQIAFQPDGPADIEIVDMKGSLIFSQHFPNAQHRLQFDVSGYAPGLYFVTLRSAGKKTTKKLLVY